MSKLLSFVTFVSLSRFFGNGVLGHCQKSHCLIFFQFFDVCTIYLHARTMAPKKGNKRKQPELEDQVKVVKVTHGEKIEKKD